MTEVVYNESRKEARSQRAGRARRMYVHTFPYRAANKVYNHVISERLLEHSRETERESSANWMPEMRASFVMQIPSAALAEKRNGDSREKRERDTRSQAFLIYPKCWRRFNSGWLADWLQARARVRAISISELYMRRVYEYLGARSRSERERE